MSERYHHLSSIIPQRSFNLKYSRRIRAPVVPHSEEFFQLSIMKIIAEADCVRSRGYHSMNGFISQQ